MPIAQSESTDADPAGDAAFANRLHDIQHRVAEQVRELQQSICQALEGIEAASSAPQSNPKRFRYDAWERPGGGGGLSAVLSEGAVFEKAGVNSSVVYGQFSPELAATMPGDGLNFYATGVSLVLHPRNPYAPTTHANFRFLRRGNAGWFGGGADLTPYYPFFEDAVHFHRTLKTVCDLHDRAYYPRFKAECDQYFFLKHRGETRGIGGLFFDYLQANSAPELDRLHSFFSDCAAAFLPAYLPILERRHVMPYTERQRQFQLYRRGRYVEFNLLYDRGTTFGLKTDGRVESILMSLPPLVRWEYDFKPEPSSPEAALADFLRPRDWLAEFAAKKP